MNNSSENKDQNVFKNNIPYPRNNLFAVLSLISGISSIMFCCLWYIGIPLSALSILFFVLDRKKNFGSNGISITALICAVSGIVFTLATFISNNFMYQQIENLLWSIYKKL